MYRNFILTGLEFPRSRYFQVRITFRLTWNLNGNRPQGVRGRQTDVSGRIHPGGGGKVIKNTYSRTSCAVRLDLYRDGGITNGKREGGRTERGRRRRRERDNSALWKKQTCSILWKNGVRHKVGCLCFSWVIIIRGVAACLTSMLLSRTVNQIAKYVTKKGLWMFLFSKS